MKTLAPAAALVTLLAAAAPARAADEAELVRAELSREVSAWNRGDLDGYLSGYERAPTTLMVGRDRVYRGFDEIAAHYHKSYATGAQMGQLAFGELEVRLLGSGYALAVGHWQLARAAADGGAVGGWFTLTLRRGAGGWRIIADHTS